MDINSGLNIQNGIKIKWNSNFEDTINICKVNNIDFILKAIGKTKKISIPIEFANIGKVLANIYFINDLISEISISSITSYNFSVENYTLIDKKLIQYFGKPKKTKKNKTIWKFGRIRIKHYFIDREGVLSDYLVLENSFSRT